MRHVKSKRDILWLIGMGVLGCFNIIDYFCTLYVVDHGIDEANPLIRPFIGSMYLPIIKLGLLSCLIVVLWVLRHIIRKNKLLLILLWIVFIVYGGVVVYHWWGIRFVIGSSSELRVF